MPTPTEHLLSRALLASTCALALAAAACGGNSPPGDDGPGPGPVVGIRAEAVASDGLSGLLDAVPSSDGATFYYVAQGKKGPGLFRVGVADRVVTELFSGAPLRSPRSLALAGDDRTLYVADPDADGGGALFALPLTDGSAPQALTATAGFRPVGVALAVAPSGDLLHFTGTDPKLQLAGVYRLAVRDGATVERVSAGPRFHSPDQLALTGSGDLYVTDLLSGGTADLLDVRDGELTGVAHALRVDGPVGVATTLDGALVLVSGIDPDKATAVVYAVRVTDGTVARFDQGISANHGAGGLHRARRGDVFAWVGKSGVKPATVYDIAPAFSPTPDGKARCIQAGSSAACTHDGQCCPATTCQQGKCGPPACGASGAACTFDAHCCFGFHCMKGKCVEQCAPLGSSCGGGVECCGGSTCLNPEEPFGPYCKQASCKHVGASCANAKDCCVAEGLSCVSGTCGVNLGCKTKGDFCSLGGCCSDLTCQNGSCRPVDNGCSANACKVAGDCCSGFCVMGVCAAGCGVNASFCNATSECCAGLTCRKNACRP